MQTNPFRPGAGHMPPYLAGREDEKTEFSKLLDQTSILDNFILTGLRGVGKTVLLDVFKPLAQESGWIWVGTDLSESASLTEQNICIRLLTDLSVLTSSITIGSHEHRGIGFTPDLEVSEQKLDYHSLKHLFDSTPGLPSDKLKAVLEFVWSIVSRIDSLKGIIFSYDEAQNLSDHSVRDQFPLSLLLDTFQSIQKKGVRFMLVLTGLPTLFPKLVEARTYAERMFSIKFLNRLNHEEARDAIEKPLENHELKLTDNSINEIIELSGGYPYFVQFICREVYDLFLQQANQGRPPIVPKDAIVQKLDSDFFSGRWSRATDRQRDLLAVIAQLNNSGEEFSAQDIVEKSKSLSNKPFGSSHTTQMLAKLSDAGLVYKNRYGKYSFAVPLLDRFILRQMEL